MGNPITWQSVVGPSAAESAARITDAASASFNRAASVAQDSFTKAEANASQQIAYQKDLNTQDYLNKVTEMGKTPEQLQAAIADGSLDKIRQSYGTVIDQAAVRGAGENLLNQRYAQAKSAMEFTHMSKDESAAPFLQEYKSAMSRGDKAGADAAYQAYVNKGGRAAGDLTLTGSAITEQNASNLRSAEKLVMEKTKQNADILNNQGLLAVAKQNAGSASLNASTNSKMVNANIQELNDKRTERLDAIEVAKRSAEAAAKLNKLQADGNIYGKGIYTGSDAPALMDTMTKMGVGGTGEAGVERRNKVLQVLGDGFVEIEGKKVPIPKSVADQVVLMAGNPFLNWGWNSGTSKIVDEQLKSLMSTVNADGKSFKHTTDLEAYQAATSNIVQHPLMGANKPKSSTPNYLTGKIR